MHAILHHLDWFTSSSNLISLGSVIVALASAAYARNSAVSSKRSYELAALQDARRSPKFVLYLSDCYSRFLEDHTVIATSLTVSNPTDIDNSIVRAELVITYHKQEGQQIKMIIASTATVPDLISGVTNLLNTPAPVPSHQSTAGVLLFEPPAAILRNSVIDSYSLNILDSHETIATMADLTVREVFTAQE